MSQISRYAECRCSVCRHAECRGAIKPWVPGRRDIAATFSTTTLSITKLYAEFWHADDVLLSVVGPIVEAYD